MKRAPAGAATLFTSGIERSPGEYLVGTDCGAAGPYYAQFTFKGNKNSVRAHYFALEKRAIRAEAR